MKSITGLPPRSCTTGYAGPRPHAVPTKPPKRLRSPRGSGFEVGHGVPGAMRGMWRGRCSERHVGCRAGAAAAAPPRARISAALATARTSLECVDRSLRTDARAEPARPDDRRRRVGASAAARHGKLVLRVPDALLELP